MGGYGSMGRWDDGDTLARSIPGPDDRLLAEAREATITQPDIGVWNGDNYINVSLLGGKLSDLQSSYVMARSLPWFRPIWMQGNATLV